MSLKNKKGSGFAIAIITTVVVMALGMFIITKVVPFSERVTGLNDSVQARYNAESAIEFAKLIYFVEEEARSGTSDYTPIHGAIVETGTEISAQIDNATYTPSSGNYGATVAASTTGILQNTDREDFSVGISSLTNVIPQPGAGNSDEAYGAERNWNKLEVGKPVRFDLSGQSGDFDWDNITNGLRIYLRLPDIDSDGDNNELVYIYASGSEPASDYSDPLLVWYIYNDDETFFPSAASSALIKSDLIDQNGVYNGDRTIPDGDSISIGGRLGVNEWKAEASPGDCYETADDISLTCFYEEVVNGCQDECYLQIDLVNSILMCDETICTNWSGEGELIDSADADKLVDLHMLEYVIEFGYEEGNSANDLIYAPDTFPVIIATGKSGGYSYQAQDSLFGELSIVTGSPVGP